MGIRAVGAAQIVLLGEVLCLSVEARQRAACVEGFNGVNLGKNFEQTFNTPVSLAAQVKGMRDADKCILRFQAGDGFLGAQTSGDFFFHKGGQNFALTG